MLAADSRRLQVKMPTINPFYLVLIEVDCQRRHK